MSALERQHWNEQYAQSKSRKYPDPDPLLLQYTPPSTRRHAGAKDGVEEWVSSSTHALDLACGVGQNGLWLAQQGYHVDLLDISREGLARAQTTALERGLSNVNFMLGDLDEVALKNEAYDLLCVFRYLKRDLLPRIRMAIRGQGRVIYQTYTTDYLATRPTMNPEYLLRPGELERYFADWKILYSTELSGVAKLVAIKPMSPSNPLTSL